MTQSLAQWASGAIGRATDPDGVAGYQCADVPKDLFERVTGRSWREGWPGAGNAKDMLDTANRDWFQVIRNDPANPEQLPRRFDIVVYAGTAPGGLNEWGHIGVVWTADRDGVVLIDQDGFQQRAMGYDSLGWDNPGTGPVLGWLRLKLPFQINPASNEKEIEDMPITPEETQAIARAVWAYKNPALERSDAYAILRATRDRVLTNPESAASIRTIRDRVTKYLDSKTSEGLALDRDQASALGDLLSALDTPETPNA